MTLDKTDFEGEAMAPEAPGPLLLQLPFGIELPGNGASEFLVAKLLGATGCDGNGTVALP
jgi:hypothetical protein